MHTRSVITNAKFVYKKHRRQLRGKVKYFQYRDNRREHIPQRDADGKPRQRWTDRGLGRSYKTITSRCHKLATEGFKHDLAARLLVISPQIDFIPYLWV